MAIRRPRIKPSANLMNRKPKSKVVAKPAENEPVSGAEESLNYAKINENEDKTNKTEELIDTKSTNLSPERVKSDDSSEDFLVKGSNPSMVAVLDDSGERMIINAESQPGAVLGDSGERMINNEESQATLTNLEILSPNTNNFKFPPKIDYNRAISQVGVNTVEDVFDSKFEEDVIHIDLQKSSNESPMSPSKPQSRQRIRPTPIFGQRRNSFIGSSPSPHTSDDLNSSGDFSMPTHRRERQYSGSLSQTGSNMSPSSYNQSPNKFPTGLGISRIRTESGCSAFSDSYAGSSGKTRKADESAQRIFSRRDYEARFTNGIPDKSALKMSDLIYYNPSTNPMELKVNTSAIKNDLLNSGNIKKDIKPAEDNCKTDEKSAILVPQLKLNSNGELILDDKSLEIETTAEQEARKVLANSSLVFLDENTGMNGFYKRHKRTKDWPPEETIKFYRCLQTVGTDFSLMCPLFAKRTRRDLKLKFKKEERCNGALINKALLYPKTFNIDDLKEQLALEERERREVERKWKEIKSKDAKYIKKVNIKSSCGARVLKHGDDIYENENVVKTKFSKRAKNVNKDCDSKVKTKNKRSKQKVDAAIVSEVEKLLVKTEAVNTDINKQSKNVCNEDTYSLSSMDTVRLEHELKDLLYPENPENEISDSPNYMENEAQALSDSDEVANSLCRTLVNLDDGTVTHVKDNENTEAQLDDTSSHSEPQLTDTNSSSEIVIPDNHSDVESDSPDAELNEKYIQQILTQLSEGSLVLVSTLDPDYPDKEINEIYILDKHTGELCDAPLDIPDVLVQCILSAIT